MQTVHQLGGYRELAPPPDLADVIEVAWVYTRGPVAPPHRVIPETAVSLAVSVHRLANGRVTDASLQIIGPIDTVRVFAPPPDLHLEAVRLKPEWSRDLLGVDAAEHFNAANPFRNEHLLRIVGKTTTSLDAIRALIAHVRDVRERARYRDGVLAHRALERVRRKESHIDLMGVARDEGVSERHLRRLIRRETGMSAKKYQRIQRLNRAVAIADVDATPDWASLAIDTGFYDQPHMIAEFRALVGSTPVQLHAERWAEVRNLQDK